MSGRGVWLRARARLRRFPAALAACGDQAAAYGRCVAAAAAGPAELRRDACLEEFQALRECFARAEEGGGALGSTWLCHVSPQTTHLWQKNRAGLGRAGS
uniref:NADH dehydrogenase [ubiquinone] 1 alpha subcomplex assembly factor 8 n=1 Tax=Catharus ustulatus TaxID=91951 RepID=A0A8C3U903_CATUS